MKENKRDGMFNRVSGSCLRFLRLQLYAFLLVTSCSLNAWMLLRAFSYFNRYKILLLVQGIKQR